MSKVQLTNASNNWKFTFKTYPKIKFEQMQSPNLPTCGTIIFKGDGIIAKGHCSNMGDFESKKRLLEDAYQKEEEVRLELKFESITVK